MLGDGQHDDLDRCDGRGQDQAVVVRMGHDAGTDETGGGTPGGLEGVLQLIVPTRKGHIVGPGELVAKIVAGAGLKGLVVLHHGLNGVGRLGPGELFLIGLAALYHGHSQGIPAEIGVAVQLLLRLGNGLLSGLVDGVALLPPELTGAQEGTGGLFPPDDGAPLVIEHGQLPVALQHIVPVVAEHGLRGGPEGQTLLQLLAAAVGDPGHLRGEALHQLPLLFQQALGDQHGHGHIHMAGFFEHPVHDALNILPNGIAIGPQDHKALDGGVIHQLRF